MIKSIKEIIESSASSYTGSEATRSIVEEEIVKRYGKAELKNYDPYHNTRTFASWVKLGFKVRKGEKAIKSMTFIEEKDVDGKVVKKIRRPVFLFYYRQIEPINQK